MPPIDFVAAGLAAAERRAWFARCRAAPVPLPRARKASVEELDVAVAAALARGRSSLEEKRMARATMSVAPPPSGGRRTCVVCGMATAQAGVPACRLCIEEIDTARVRLDGRRRVARAAIEVATADAQAARNALDERDQRRWDKIVAARLKAARDESARAWVGKVKAAIDNATSPAVSDAIRRVWWADEALHWTIEGAAEEMRRADVAETQLEASVKQKEGQL
jgi:hypothetical protein